LKTRQKLATNGRQTSIKNQKQLTAEIMDVTQSEVASAMQRHNVDLLIHGHTHRPNVHEFTLDNRSMKRIVLGDWYDQGSILIANKQQLSLENRIF
jgi:UDP-2,3-diacylglucosamine hydrolase